jgi:hypothetical protein
VRNVIELQTLVHGMSSIRLLLEGNRQDRIHCVLLEIVEEKLVLLHSDRCNERGINDAISIADIILSQVKLVTVAIIKNVGRRHVEMEVGCKFLGKITINFMILLLSSFHLS